MDMSVSIQAGTFSYEVQVTDTGPDGCRDVQTAATTHFLALLGDGAAQALQDAAHALPTLDEG